MSYGTASGFRDYHVSRGRVVSSDWDDSIITAALLVASEWLDTAYDHLWYGYAVGGYTQTRKWPRAAAQTNTNPVHVFSESAIPDQVLYATYEAAFREATTAGALTVDHTPLKYKSAMVDGAVDVEYIIPNDASEIQLQMPIIGTLMNVLIDPRVGSSRNGYSSGSVRT